MSEIKCPFCGEKIKHIEDGWCNCKNRCVGSGSISLWQELIKVMEENKRTRKALDVARNGLEYIFGYVGVPKYVVKHIRQVLDQIKSETTLEQKD